MANKSTYEELEQRVRELEKDARDRKRLDERLRLLSYAAEQSTEGIAMSDSEGNLLFVNNAFAAMHGYTSEELVGKHLSIFHTDEQIPSVEAANRQLQETGEFSGEIWHVRRDDTVFPTWMHNSLLRDEAGNPIGMIGTLRDITERKRAEETLKESEEKYRLIFENSPLGVCHFDSKGVVTACNDKLAEILGAPKAKVVGVDMPNTFEDERQKAALEAALSGRIGIFEGDYVSITGEKASNIRTIYAPITSDDGTASGGIAITEDITDRKQIEEALKESETRYRTFFEQSPDAVVIIDPVTTLPIEFNDKAQKLLGYTPQEFSRLSIFDYEVLETSEEIETHKKKVLQTGEDKFETKMRTESGDILDIIVNIKVVEIGGKQVFHNIFQDITDRKQAEKALRESEEQYRSLIHRIQAAVVVHGADTQIIASNPKAQELLGLTEHQMLGKTAFDPDWKFLSAEGKRMPLEEYPVNQVLATQQPLRDLTGGVYRPDTGDLVWVLVSADPVFDDKGGIQQVIVTFMDITDSNRAEEELRRSQDYLHRILDGMWDGLMVLDRDLRITDVNPRFLDEYNGTREEVVDQYCWAITHKFDVPCGRKGIDCPGRQVFKTGKPAKAEHYHMNHEGNDIFVELYAFPLLDDKGNVERVVEMHHDITNRKQAESALKEKEQKLEQQARHLVEVNTAVKVLIKHGEEEKGKLEESILMNLRKLVLPYIEKLDKGRIEGENRTYLSIIKSNLENLVSPFANRLFSKALNFTPTEIQVADFVKHGQTSKEIASMLNVSPNAVMFHRKNIRKKLGLANKKSNLRTYLQSLSI